MGRKKKKLDYRQYYRDYYGIDFGPDMVVHHIDFDRSNNNIDNLLLMPSELHSKYHLAIRILGGEGSGIIDGNARIVCDGSHGYRAAFYKSLGDAMVEIDKWVILKQRMEYARWQDNIHQTTSLRSDSICLM